MKKSLFALAALGAFATAAQAQSSVTLFGNLDASLQYISNAGVAGSSTASGTNVGTGNSSTNPTLPGPNTGSVPVGLVDGAISTSMWGMKGSEDLGGGMKANFYVAGDLRTDNGGTHQEGLFRRGAWVGLQGGFGEVRLGLHSNPIADAQATLMPVGGNTVNMIRNVIGFAGKDFNRNAVTYVTPNLSGFGAVLQYALNNTTDGGLNDGTVLNARAYYNAGNLDLAAAYQKRRSLAATGTASYGNCGLVNSTSAATAPSATNSYPTQTCVDANQGGDVTGYLAGIKYRVTPAIQLGVAFAHGDGDNTTALQGVSVATTAAQAAAAANVYSANAWELGVGYQASPTLLLGANAILTTADSKMYNLQARYSLSKRTTLYAQANMSVNGAGSSYTGGAATTPFGNFAAVAIPSGTGPSLNISGMASATGLPNTTQSAVGVGVIHSF